MSVPSGACAFRGGFGGADEDSSSCSVLQNGERAQPILCVVPVADSDAQGRYWQPSRDVFLKVNS